MARARAMAHGGWVSARAHATQIPWLPEQLSAQGSVKTRFLGARPPTPPTRHLTGDSFLSSDSLCCVICLCPFGLIPSRPDVHGHACISLKLASSIPMPFTLKLAAGTTSRRLRNPKASSSPLSAEASAAHAARISANVTRLEIMGIHAHTLFGINGLVDSSHQAALSLLLLSFRWHLCDM